ncbi:MAG: phage tail protein [Alphaproteobacteria bacterium]|nr:phage tail protein [Alphaproteobacteria bacterium]
MGGLTNASTSSNLQSFRYQTSEQGAVIPICYGWNRITPNLIEYFGLAANGGGKGGKGGGPSGGKGKSNNTQYSVYVAFGLCQGPIAGVGQTWVSQGVEDFASTDLSLYAGADAQAPDPVFETIDTNTPVLGYSGTAYVTGTPLQLGSAPALPNFGFEVEGSFAGSNANFPQDANPSDIVTDLLTNPRYGAEFSLANLDDLTDYGAYCAAAGLMLSPVLDREQEAGQYLSDLATVTNSAILWSGNRLKFVPYGDAALAANGVTWTPNLTPLYSLDDDDFLPWEGSDRTAGASAPGSQDPVTVTRINPADATNWLSLEFADRANYYDFAVAAVFDQAAIDQFGLRMEAAIEAHGVCQMPIAATAAQLLLQRRQYIRNTYRFQLGWKYCLLEPMDIVLLTDAGLGLEAAPVRITAIEENDNGDLTIDAEEIPGVTG